MHTVQILNHIVQDHQFLAYLVIFIGLIFEGEIVVITTGVLAHLGALDFTTSLLFILGGGAVKTFGGYYLGGLLRKRYNQHAFFVYLEKRIAFFMPRFKERPFWSIFISQFIMGVNYLVIIFSGYTKVDYKTYLKADLLSTAIWAPLLLSIGFFFSQTALSYTKEVNRFSLIILVFVIIFLIFDKLVAYFFRISQYLKNINRSLADKDNGKE